MTLDQVIAEAMIEDWYITNLINLGPADWQANISDGEFVTTGTGTTIEEALCAASDNAYEGKVLGRLAHLPTPKIDLQPSGLLAALGLVRKTEPIKRRI
jgi:hypothetical protein